MGFFDSGGGFFEGKTETYVGLIADPALEMRGYSRGVQIASKDGPLSNEQIKKSSDEFKKQIEEAQKRVAAGMPLPGDLSSQKNTPSGLEDFGNKFLIGGLIVLAIVILK